MEKFIRIMMEDDESVIFAVDDKKLSIGKDNRTISAQNIYELLNIQCDDKITIEEYNPNPNFDKQNEVGKYFHSLIKEIVISVTKNILEKDDDV